MRGHRHTLSPCVLSLGVGEVADEPRGIDQAAATDCTFGEADTSGNVAFRRRRYRRCRRPQKRRLRAADIVAVPTPSPGVGPGPAPFSHFGLSTESAVEEARRGVGVGPFGEEGT